MTDISTEHVVGNGAFTGSSASARVLVSPNEEEQQRVSIKGLRVLLIALTILSRAIGEV